MVRFNVRVSASVRVRPSVSVSVRVSAHLAPCAVQCWCRVYMRAEAMPRRRHDDTT